MKNLLFSLLFLIVPTASSFAYSQNPGLDAIASALSIGDADALAKFFADNVEVSIQDKEQTYPKAKAAETVKSFFAGNKPKGFAQVHKGTSRENSDQYCIGNLNAASGNYRVYIYLKSVGNNLQIQEIRFDKE